ncbi:bifunctional 4-hydroxy-2-oxoglutarate aldolase/2-dehydro-3-deoxy-phosphogluconate aldolase [Candidatus Bipolaricaulota bacterium]
MSRRFATVRRIGEEKVIAIVRGDAMKDLLALSDGLCEVGVRILEVTFTTPNALNEIEKLRLVRPSLTLGMGSVLNAGMVRDAAAAGADFVVSPIYEPAMIEAAHEQDLAVIPGAFTPTEAQAAFEAGADMVKIFPASVLGPAFVSSLLAPLPHLKLVPTGGVNLDNVKEFLDAGAFAVCLGKHLVDRVSLRTGEYGDVLARARKLVAILRTHREGDRNDVN